MSFATMDNVRTPPVVPLRQWLGRAAANEPLFAGAALFLLALTVPTLAAMALDQRTLLGENVWIKPFKFETALIVYLGTLAWFAGYLPAGTTAKRWYRIFAGIVVFCIAGEMAWIIGASAFGVGSHFNEATPLMAVLYPLMGLFAVTLTSATLVYGILIARNPHPDLAPPTRLGLSLGLVLTFATTVIVAGTLAGNGSHFVGGSGSDIGGFPLMGWSRDGGDLRVAHFLATHAMHAVPLAGLAASRLVPGTGNAKAFVWAATGAYTLLTGYTFIEALAGRPFLPFIG